MRHKAEASTVSSVEFDNVQSVKLSSVAKQPLTIDITVSSDLGADGRLESSGRYLPKLDKQSSKYLTLHNCDKRNTFLFAVALFQVSCASLALDLDSFSATRSRTPCPLQAISRFAAAQSHRREV